MMQPGYRGGRGEVESKKGTDIGRIQEQRGISLSLQHMAWDKAGSPIEPERAAGCRHDKGEIVTLGVVWLL